MTAYQKKRDISGFYLTEGPVWVPTAIWIDSERIDECMAYYRAHNLSRIAISDSLGYQLGDLSFLRDHPYVRGVNLAYSSKIDISGLSFLTDLEYLLVSDTKQPLDLTQFKRLQEFRGDWRPTLKLPEGDAALRVLALWKYRSAAGNLSGLPWLARLEDLSIVQSRITSAEGVQRYKTLRRLELSYCTDLADISQVAGLADGKMEVLECEKCRKIANHWSVAGLPEIGGHNTYLRRTMTDQRGCVRTYDYDAWGRLRITGDYGDTILNC